MLYSETVTLSTDEALVVTGNDNGHSVCIIGADANCRIGGQVDNAVFPVPSLAADEPPLCLHVAPGDTIYAKSTTGTPVLYILHNGLSATPA